MRWLRKCFLFDVMDLQTNDRKYGEGVIPLLFGAFVFWASIVTVSYWLLH